MTKEEIIRELNTCDFQDRQVLAEIGVMADGALWMQKRLIDKACEWLKNNTPIGLMEDELSDFFEDFKKAMEE